MTSRSYLLSAVAIAALLACGGTASAATVHVTWGFGDATETTTDTGLNNLAIGLSETVTPPGFPGLGILVTGVGLSVNPSNVPHPGAAGQLYRKNGGAGSDEIGLGFTNDPSGDDEMTPGSGFIQLTMHNITSPPLTSLSLSFGTSSTTGDDHWEVVGSNTAGDDKTSDGAVMLLTGHSDTVVTLNDLAGWAYIDVFATNGNVLLNEVDAMVDPVATPEPATFGLLGVGLLGLGFVANRKRA